MIIMYQSYNELFFTTTQKEAFFIEQYFTNAHRDLDDFDRLEIELTDDEPAVGITTGQLHVDAKFIKES